MAISKATILSDIYLLIYNRLVSQVTTVTLSDASVRTIQTHTGYFPEKEADSKSHYPIIVVEPVTGSWDDITFTKKLFMGNFSVRVYETSAQGADRFIQAMIDAIETYRTTLWSGGNDMRFLQLDGIDIDNVERGGFTVHIRTARFSYEVPFTKTAP